eukprot:4533299-Prymnesium_polylepis.1
MTRARARDTQHDDAMRRRSRCERGGDAQIRGERRTRRVRRALGVDRFKVHRQVGDLAAPDVPLDLENDFVRLHVETGSERLELGARARRQD